MSRMTAFSSPLLLGFDDIERLLDRVSKTSADGYPPYNIERIVPPGGEVQDAGAEEGAGPTRIRITLAVAGFSPRDLDISVEENELVIRGRQTEEQGREFLHRGIAARQFQRTFVLADGMRVTGADLKDGLLAIDLERPEPVKTVRKIQIVSRD
ncbi:Molecular chaperone IbpA, HSP20 family [Faunimonas pinastri]|uniref:Molecular chaperone IbpA, HSP20 family n=1 Tax=Faunimonas pinastri TaxID=1855383 RepID=A0A1H9ISW7_9HYPH|nr:Hsp20 family protein [Faunimonas pinastri]SEQ77861.1 Molecular chaperone IbpA, HSP20 family [Faunimonas pinastri]